MSWKEHLQIFLFCSILVFGFWGAFKLYILYMDLSLSKEQINVINYKDPVQNKTKKIFDKLIKANNLNKKNYKLKIFDKYTENLPEAYVQLGRVIILKESFLKEFKSEQGIAFAIAHEISHVELGQTTSVIYRLQNVLNPQGYSCKRDNYKIETEADLHAIKLLKKTYIKLNYDEVVELFIRDQKLHEEYKIEDNEVYEKHPPHETRMKYIKKALDSN